MDFILPRTDAGVLVQLIALSVVGGPLLYLTVRRGNRDMAWFVGGLLVFFLGFFAFRSAH